MEGPWENTPQLQAVGWGKQEVWVSSDGLLQARMVGVNGGSHGEGSGRRCQSLRKQELQGPYRTLKALLRACWMVPLAPELVKP